MTTISIHGRCKTAHVGSFSKRSASKSLTSPDSKIQPNQSRNQLANSDAQKSENFKFSRPDWTLFRTPSTLSQKAGVPLAKLRALVVKEVVDNALDASGSCTLAKIGDDTYVIEDQGEGISGAADEIASMFSFGRPLDSTKLLRLPKRGALGNGLRVVAGAVLCCDGTIVVETRNQRHLISPQDDGTSTVETERANRAAGTRIEITLPGILPFDSRDVAWGNEAIAMAQGEVYRGRTSAHWYTNDDFFELCQAAGDRPIRDLVERIDGCSGAKAGLITAAHKARPANTLSRAETFQLLDLIRSSTKRVKPSRLGSIGPSDIAVGYAKSEGELQLPGSKRTGLVPLVVEAWAHVGAGDRISVCVNRTPITGEVELYRTQGERASVSIFGCGLQYKVKVGTTPLRFIVNIITPYMPITTDGKEPNLDMMSDELIEAIEKAARRARRANPSGADRGATQKTTIIDALPDAIAKSSGNGTYRFSQRTLYYAVRPVVIELLGREINYDWFCSVLGEHESEHGDIKGMYRDPRGIIYHPHERREIPLGTLECERYERPTWTFNKVLYCEKEGLFSILRSVNWPEKHDCALMTSKGYASRAARDLLDQIGDGDGELEIYCIHDADAAGTMIYQTLQNETKARGGRKVRVVNLGLEPDEAIAMGLEVESVKYKKTAGAADYVSSERRAWLQTKRVELNAMTTPQFLEWLDRKMENAAGKIVPPADILHTEIVARTEHHLREQLTAEALREAKIDERVHDGIALMSNSLKAMAKKLPKAIRAKLKDRPEQLWSTPVDEIGKDQAAQYVGGH